MTDPLARWLQKPAAPPTDPLDKWLQKPTTADTSFSGSYQPSSEPLYGDGEDQPSLLSKIAKLPLALGKGMLESVDVFPEIHGGESIPLRSRLARGFNLATMAVPITSPFRLAATARMGTKIAAAAAGNAVYSGIAGAIEGVPIVPRAASGAGVGAALQTGISLITRRNLRVSGAASKVRFSDDAKFSDPAETPFNSSDWAITSPAFTRPGRKLEPAANASRAESAKRQMADMGQEYTDVHGYRSGSNRPDAAVLLHGADDAKAVRLAQEWDQDWVVTKSGRYDLTKQTISPITAMRFDAAIRPSDDVTEMIVNGQSRKVAFEFGTPQPINPKAVGRKSKYVQHDPDQPQFETEPSISAKAKMLIVKGMRYVHGAEKFEEFIGAKETGTFSLPSETARQDVGGLAEVSLKHTGPKSFVDRQTPLYNKSYQQIVEQLKGNEVSSFDDYLAARSKANIDNAVEKKATALEQKRLADFQLSWQTRLAVATPKRATVQKYLRERLAMQRQAKADADIIRTEHLSPADAAAIKADITDLETNFPHFSSLAEDINDYRKATREWLYESNAHNRDELDAINDRLDHVFDGTTLDKVPNRSPLQSVVSETVELANLARRSKTASSMVEWLESLDPEVRAQYADEIVDSPDIVGEIFQTRSPTFKSDKTIISGISSLTNTKKSFKLKDESLSEMFHAMDPVEMNLYMKVFTPFASFLRAAATLTPEFMSKNVLRDWLSGKVTTGASFKQMASGFFSVFTKDAKYQEALAAGAFNGELLAHDVKVAENLVKRWTGTRSTSEKLIDNVIKGPKEALQSLSMALERGTRLGAYHATYAKNIAAGLSPEKAVRGAAIATKNFSTDFSMYGSRTAPARLTTAFWNAMMQGYYRVQESARSDPAGFLTRGLGYITLPSVLLYLKNRKDPEYTQLPSWERTMFWHVKVGDNWHRFPKPFDLGVMFGSSMERVLEALDSDDPRILDDFAADYTKQTSFDFIPIPTGARPFYENVTNKSLLRQRPIVSKALENVEPKYQQQPGTSDVAIKLGAWFNQSPVQIDNVIGGLTAGVGRMAAETISRTADLGDAIFDADKTIKDALPTFDAKSTWGLRGFTSQFPRNAEPIDKLYDFVDKARVAAQTSSYLERSLHIDDLVDWTENKAALAGIFPDLQEVLTDLGELRAQRVRLYDDESMSPREQKRQLEALDRQMLDIANQLNNAIKPLTRKEK